MRRTIEVPGGRIAYERSGDGRPVVFLHAGALDMRMWTPQVAGFDAGWTVVRTDARGHGASSTPDRPFRQCDDIAAVTSDLGLGPAVLVGVSMGGAAAVDTALEHPALVAGIVVIGAGATGHAGRDDELFVDPWTRERLRRLASAAAAGDPAAWTETFVEINLAGPQRPLTRVDPVLVDEVRRMITDTLVTHAAGLGVLPEPVTDAPARIAEITVPVLGIAGALDSPDHLRMVSELVDGVDRGRLEIIEGAAHLPNLEQPAAFDAVLRGFLDEVAAARVG
ncbi:alpha/beta fold hydrolase [Pseudonocardia sp. TRM90224]|uniref:alpha/beta fold hydrolase n=1 Tax=Pseudonocardia sp. TRM90224 TaxID=2812678 RepID=UPI001E3F7CD6|nr:alpha/beta hydrolase [Pseudonocardia sp. TRM90224]